MEGERERGGCREREKRESRRDRGSEKTMNKQVSEGQFSIYFKCINIYLLL